MKGSLIASTLLAAAFVAGEARADLRVVATVPDLAALAKSVGGDRVNVVSLALPNQDPHFVDARPHLALELSKADLLLAVGLELEQGWLPTLQTGSRNGKIQRGAAGYVDCSTFVSVLEAPAQKIDRSMGDIHPGGNPHYLLDPRRAAQVARGIAAKMAELDHEHAADYKAGGDRTAQEIEKASARWLQQLASLKGAKVVGYHKSWPYLADWAGLAIVEHIEPKPGIPPDPAHVVKVIGVMKQDKVRIVLQEGYYADTTSKLVASKTDARVVTIPGGADFAKGQTYVARFEKVVALLKEGAPSSG